MAITRTSIQNVVFAQRIKDGIELAKAGRGEEMNGHGNRVYIANRKGHNVMRIDWRDGKVQVWGDESKDITKMVMSALYLEPLRKVLSMPKRATPEAVVKAATTIVGFERELKAVGNYKLFTLTTPGKEKQFVVRAADGSYIGTYNYESAAELKAFMLNKGH